MKVLFLTEGGGNIGFGHLTRCLALAQGFKKVSGKFIVNGDKNAKNFLNRQNVKPIMLNWLKEKKYVLKSLEQAKLIIIDSYLAPPSFYSFISQMKPRSQFKPYIVAIDDYNRINYDADIVINPSIYGDKLNYKKSSDAKPVYLFGKNYIILRKEFCNVSKKYTKRKVRDILITFGGSNHTSFTKRLLGFLLEKFPQFTYHVVTSKKFNFKFHCQSFRPSTCLPIKFYYFLSAPDMLKAMLKCDLCISAGGQTLHELARAGVPTIGICFTNDQLLNLENWQKEKFVEYIGWHNDKKILFKLEESIHRLISYKERVRRSDTGKSLVDAKGVKRITAVFN